MQTSSDLSDLMMIRMKVKSVFKLIWETVDLLSLKVLFLIFLVMKNSGLSEIQKMHFLLRYVWQNAYELMS